MSTENQLATTEEPTTRSLTTSQPQPLFSSSGFEMAQRMATALSKSTLIPEAFRNNLPNCLIALEMSNRMGASPMMVMQNLYIVHGRPAWSSQFVIAAINATKRFSPLRFDMTGEGAARECFAWAVELATKERLEGPPVNMAMAKAEGWSTKNGSKWQTMPELMLRYRAATFFGRLYAPEILMGMKEETEVIDVDATVTTSEIPRAQIGATGTTTAARVGDSLGVATTESHASSEDAPRTTVTIEPPASGKGTPRKRLPKKPEPEPETPAPEPSVLATLRAKLEEAGYTPEQLFAVAVENKFGIQEGWTRLEDMTDDKLETFVEDWETALTLLGQMHGAKREKSPLD